MSLRVWLPLNGDLHNQGLSNISLSGSPIWGTGKIGGKSFCCNTGITGITIDDLVNVTEFSIAYWLYIDSSITDFTNYADFWELQAVSGDTTTVIRDELRVNTANLGRHAPHMIKDASVGSNTYTYYTLGERDDAKDKWCHVVITKNATYCDAYADGVRYAHVACSNFESSPAKLNGKFWLGMGGCKSAYLNDFRIYDHCLSQMEVKELAKGLVLHYPLNRGGWGQINNIAATKVVNRSCNNFTYNSSTNEWSMSCPAGSGTWGYGIAISDTAIKWATNQTWVISMEVYVPRSITWNCDINNKPDLADVSEYTGNDYDITGQRLVCTNDVMGDKTLQTGWNKIWFSQTAGTTYGLYNYSTNWGVVTTNESTAIDIKIKNVKGEIINAGLPIQPTPWCPNSADVLGTALNINGTTEYDCSGFGNNGTRIGTFTWTSDTPKYNVSTQFNSTSTKIAITGLTTTGFANSYSFAWWAKKVSNAHMDWGFSDGIRLNGMYTGHLWNTGDGSDNPLYNIGTTTQVTDPTLNVWHHYVMTGNGSKCYVYKDGVLWAEAKTYKAISGTTIYINGWNSSTSYSHTNYQMSDFRIYATALSASDVKSLYQNSAYIDSSGNVYGAVYEEG